jgi:hypothetical protein
MRVRVYFTLPDYRRRHNSLRSNTIRFQGGRKSRLESPIFFIRFNRKSRFRLELEAGSQMNSRRAAREYVPRRSIDRNAIPMGRSSGFGRAIAQVPPR